MEMPNWAEGVLKVKGTRENIKRFLFEGLEAIPDMSQQFKVIMGKQNEIEEPNVKIDEDEWDLTMNTPNGFYIKGTRRAFIENGIEWYFNDSHLEILTIESFKQAWGVDADSFAEISKQYEIDIKIYVFERGMEFNQDIEIHKGEIIKDNEIKFDEYEWECLYPNLGG